MCQHRQGSPRLTRSILPSICLALLAACCGDSTPTLHGPGGGGSATPDGGPGSPNPGEAGASGDGGAQKTTFESDDPTHQSDTNGGTLAADAGSNAAAPAAGQAADGAKESAERAIAEADVIQIDKDTNRLYALSEYGGLSIIDISVPEKLQMLGRYVVRASPFEMYVRAGVAYAMYSSYATWETGAEGAWVSHTTSKLVAFDVHDPANIKEIGSFAMPGEVSDSRMVGDVIYVASYENGNCWRCAAGQPRTAVTSIAIGNPAAIGTVDQLTFDDPKNTYGWYRRSISVNTDRLYVSGMVYDNTWGSGTGHSTIQVVDISDPAGDLKAGATIEVSGSIENRWEMDEYNGVLRVISQSGSAWSNGPAPTVETFKVTTASDVKPLGKLTMTLPKVENLKSVRFDATRAYAVTFEQKDPLFTLDLTDPAQPKQVGELEMPGFLYHMEPRGDRMIALGMDNGNTSGGLTVSVFDVADLAKPTLLQRANFGGNWSWAPEDQDRIHKAFKIFDEANLIAMPFSGYTYTDGGCGRYTSGVQLFDFTRDTVTKRGILPVRGQAKRSFLHAGRMYAMSDDQVASYNIENRDAPARLGSVALANTANKAVRIGSNIVALGSDWYTQSPQIVVVPVAGSDPRVGSSALPVATIDLGVALSSNDNECRGYWSSFSNNSELFVNGNLVYVVYSGGFASQQGQMGFAVIDLKDPLHPVLAGHKLIPMGSTVSSPKGGSYYYGSGFSMGYYYPYNGLYASGKRIVQTGSTVALQELIPQATPDGGQDPYGYPEVTSNVHAVDLSDPANIRLVSSTPLNAGPSASGLFVDGSSVFTSHYETLADRPGRLRFYVDQVNLAAPATPAQTTINVPGSLFGVDAGAKRFVTIDYSRTVEPIAANPEGGYTNYYDQCRTTAPFGASWLVYNRTAVDAGTTTYYRNNYPESCVRVDRSFKLVEVTDGNATLLDTFVPTGKRVDAATMGSDRILLTTRDYATSRMQMSIDVLAGIRSGKFVVASTLALKSSQSPVIDGMRFALAPSWSDPNLLVYDLQDASQPTKILETASLASNYWVYAMTLDPKYAVLAMGPYGVSAVPLP